MMKVFHDLFLPGISSNYFSGNLNYVELEHIRHINLVVLGLLGQLSQNMISVWSLPIEIIFF